jgi:hypothetical protein
MSSTSKACQQSAKLVKEYVHLQNCVSIPEYGLDCQSRRSKSCVVNNGTLSTEVLRVAIGYRSTKSTLFRLYGFRSKRWPKQWLRRASPGSRRSNNRAHFSQQRDHGRAELCLRLCISTGYKRMRLHARSQVDRWVDSPFSCTHSFDFTFAPML